VFVPLSVRSPLLRSFAGPETLHDPHPSGSGSVTTWLGASLVVGNGTYPNALFLAGSTFPTGGLKTQSGTTTWTGAIGMTSPDSAIDVTGALVVSGPIAGPNGGGLTVRGTGELRITNVSTYTGGTTIDGGAKLVCTAGSAIPDGGRVVNDGVLAIETSETIGPLDGLGSVTLDASTVLMTGGNTPGFFQGAIVGRGA
jgi:fibronectin-binding autotransporter adhesin